MTMTKAEMTIKLAELETALELEKAKSESVKSRIMKAIKDGANTMDKLAIELNVGRKSLSSNLTRLRKELRSENLIILTQRLDGETMVAVMNLVDLGWAEPVVAKEKIVLEDKPEMFDDLDEYDEDLKADLPEVDVDFVDEDREFDLDEDISDM